MDFILSLPIGMLILTAVYAVSIPFVVGWVIVDLWTDRNNALTLTTVESNALTEMRLVRVAKRNGEQL